VIWTVFRLISGAIDKVRLESFDRQLGAMFGLAKGVLLCVAITFFAVGLLSEQEGQAIVASKSGQGVVWVVRKAHAVFPPEMHEYLHKIEERLDPALHPRGGASQAAWPGQSQSQTQSQSGSGWPQISWPQSQSQPQPQSQPQELGWPYSSGSQSGRSSSTQPSGAPPERNPYSMPREPNPFPGPYSAEVPTSRDY
jgi:membrane protein required for colicin V production